MATSKDGVIKYHMDVLNPLFPYVLFLGSVNRLTSMDTTVDFCGVKKIITDNMSTSLYWSRVPVEPKEESIYSLKYVLSIKLWNGDGSSSQSTIRVDEELIPFLEGIEEGNGNGDMARDARKLINAIKKYGEVQLCIHS